MTYRTIIVDDDSDLRTLLRGVIERNDKFEIVGEAENGVEAIRLAEELHPDLVVLDVIMPVLDGLRALPKIVATGARVVMLTGMLHEDIINRAGLRGATCFVDKANAVDDLCLALEFAASRRTFIRFADTRKLR